jgi:hypothetical protein
MSAARDATTAAHPARKRLVQTVLALKAGVALLRWALAALVGHGALVALAVLVLLVGRGEQPDGALPDKPASSSGEARLFDRAVLRALTRSALAGRDQHFLESVWAQRPPYPRAPSTRVAASLLGPGQALARVFGRVPTDLNRAVRGVRDVLPFELGGLLLALFAAGLAGSFAAALRPTPLGDERALRAMVIGALAVGLIAYPVIEMLRPEPFHQRTVSLGVGFSAVLFVAAFAATLPRAAAHWLGVDLAPARFAGGVGGPAWLLGARIAVVGACESLVAAVPAVTAAALFVRAKAHQDVSLHDEGLGRLINAALSAAGAADPDYEQALAPCVLLIGALLLLSYLGHRFLVEVRWVLASQSAAAERS